MALLRSGRPGPQLPAQPRPGERTRLRDRSRRRLRAMPAAALLLALTTLLTLAPLVMLSVAGCQSLRTLTKPLTGEVRPTTRKGALGSGVRRDLAIESVTFDPLPYQKNENKGALDFFFAPTDKITFKVTVVNNGASTESNVQTEAFLYQTTSGGLPREVPSELVAEKSQSIAELAADQSRPVSYTFTGLKRYRQKSHLVARFSVMPPPGETNNGNNLRKVYFWILIGE